MSKVISETVTLSQNDADKLLNPETTEVSMNKDGDISTKTSNKEGLEEDYKYLAAAYQLISEGLILGKNSYTVKDTLEYIDKKFKLAYDELQAITKKEKGE